SGGVIFVEVASIIVIDHSYFVNNTGHEWGVTKGDTAEAFVPCRYLRPHIVAEVRSGEAEVRRSEAEVCGGEAEEGGVLFGEVDILMNITDSIVANNNAPNGGVVNVDYSAHVTITRSSVTGNRADKYGGALYFDINAAVIIADSNLTDNNAIQEGGVAFTTALTTITFIACDLTANLAVEGGGVAHGYTTNIFTITSCHLASNAAEQGGVVSSSSHTTITFTACNLTSNKALEFGGVVSSKLTSTITIADSLVAHNTADGYGGVMYTPSSNNITIARSNVTSNTAGEKGGVLMLIQDSNIEIVDSNVTFNLADGDGGVVCSSTRTNITIANSSVIGSTANGVGGGGVIYMDSEMDITITESLFDGNSAAEGTGGIAVIRHNGSLTVANSRMLRSTAAKCGGALHLVGSSGALSNMTASENFALDGGVVCLEAGSHLAVAGSIFLDNAALDMGGVIYATASAVDISGQSELRGNNASSGGCVWASVSDVRVSGSTLESNMVTNVGGALAASSESVVNITHTSLSRNAAQSGGAVSVASSSLAFAMDNCHLNGNHATQGGAVYMNTPERNVSRVLRSLNLTSNTALVNGPNVFWEYGEDEAEPECVNCSHHPVSEALQASSAMRFVVLQNDTTVTNGSTIYAASGSVFSPQLVYAALDFYGALTLASDELLVLATTSEGVLSGLYNAIYSTQGALFTDLSLIATPGLPVEIGFEPQTYRWESISLTVIMESCRDGERYIENARTCEVCAEGTLKFDNSTDACYECGDQGIACQGGSRYTLDDGYWLAAVSVARCREAGNDAEECVFERVYACDIEAACTSSDRTNADDEVAVSTSSQCAEGYRADVPLCSVCDAGYEMTWKRCKLCSETIAEYIVQLFGLLIGLLLALTLLWYLLKRYHQRSVTKAHSADELGERNPGSGMGEVFSSYIQIMTQHLHVLPEDVFPSVYYDFIKCFSVFDFSLVSWVSVQCLIAGSTSGPTFEEVMGFGTFYFEFLTTTVTPFLIALSAMGPLTRKLKKKSQVFWRANMTHESQKSPAPEPSGDDDVAHPDVTYMIASFMLTFIHPSVSTACFNVFFCDGIHFESEQIDYFLHSDRSAQCFTSQWFSFMALAIFVILAYVLLLPIGLIVLTFNLHGRKKVKLGSQYRYVRERDICIEYETIGEASDSDVDEGASDEGSSDGSREGTSESSSTGSSDGSSASSEAAACYSIVDPATGMLLAVEPVFIEGADPGSGLGHMESRLDDPEIAKILEPYVGPYRREYFYWSGVDILIRLSQTSMVVLVKMMGDDYDVLYLSVVTVLALATHSYVQPYVSSDTNILETLSLLSQSMAVHGYIATGFIHEDGSDESAATGIALLLVQTAFLVAMCHSFMRMLKWEYEHELGDHIDTARRKGGKYVTQIVSAIKRSRRTTLGLELDGKIEQSTGNCY
ncbi:hypothetical protein CYMTET_31703, partial [Cymbomonas tetramitiformis]